MLHDFKVWAISGWVHAAIGAALMFMILKRPQTLKDWETKAWAWIKAKLHLP